MSRRRHLDALRQLAEEEGQETELRVPINARLDRLVRMLRELRDG